MKHILGSIAFFICVINIESHPRHERSDKQSNNNKLLTDYSDDVQNYLMEFGYLPKSNSETGNLRIEEQLRNAIRRLQAFAGIPQTGKMDAKTNLLMKSPRCGVPDDFDSSDFKQRQRTRFKRFVINNGQKWENTNLTWSFVNQTMTNIDAGMARRIFHEALAIWSKDSKLNFREVYDPNADIQIMFAQEDHGDGFRFDGPGNVLAHAFYPGSGRGGDAHFDQDEAWHLDDRTIEHSGTSLKNVAIHEFGHSLGLGHSSVKGAVMFPWYHGYRGDGDLPEDDRLAIQTLYGVRDGARQWGPNPRRHHYTSSTPRTTTTRTTTTYRPRHYTPDQRHYPDQPRRNPNEYPSRYPSYSTTTTTTTRRPTYHHNNRNNHHHQHHNKQHTNHGHDKKPDTCSTSYDAITMIRGEIFIFKGRYFWRIGQDGLQPGYPHEISKMWRDLPHNMTHIDAVYENKKHQIVFFIGNQYYIFNTQHLLETQPLSTLGLPENLKKIDAALVWGHNNRTYFYSGTKYWRFDEDEMHVELDYPRDMSMWRGIGYDIDSAFQYKDGKTYFFKGSGYWQFDDMKMRVVHDRQKKSAYRWMGCKQKHERLDDDSNERRQYWRNPRRDEETSDVDDDDLYSNEDIDIVTSTASASILLELISFKILLSISLGAFLNSIITRRMT
ncbi:hypothetical protein PVAND_014115 [Polypedilum vanderplanki]|uniref:Peptidase metallopeptidase domain-containing protein n=1 Tax=Polypedilum vanderplanki TaxID=319348 RepID=A0A9J6CRS1_POLVA|nr:hypothetical protein PVAND_014115 [Polypedilum vanderplanki]